MEFYDYLKAYRPYFWQWEGNTQVLAIPGGSTIGYTEMVMEVLDHLAPQGIPPFGTLLLALIATNSAADEAISMAGIKLEQCIKDKAVPANQGYLGDLAEALHFLRTLAGLPVAYKTGKHRLLLLQTIFSGSHNRVATDKAKRIVNQYKDCYFKPETLEKPATILSIGTINREIRSLVLLNKKFPNTESILNKIAGLPDANITIEPEAQPGNNADNKPRDFVQQLIDDVKTFHTGTLIKHIWTGLKIPYHNSLPSMQPLGGVSDLTNKGQFDKLLISEFANDDLVFLSRIANNEALFYNREMPPVNDNVERVILVDVSLKNWGTPKIIGFAAFLAIVKHPKTDITCTAFAIGNTYQPLQFDNIHQVINGLQLVEGSLHCSNGLQLFLKDYTRLHKIEIFLITSPESMKLPAMLKTISDNNNYFKYIITTEVSGKIHLYHNKHNSVKLIQDIQLPLAELWKKNYNHPDKKKRARTALYYPVLFNNSTVIKKILKAEDGEVFMVTSTRDVFKFYDKNKKHNEKGWQLVWEDLPAAINYFAIGIIDRQHVLLCFKEQTKNVLLINLTSRKEKNILFAAWQPSEYNSFIFFGGDFLYLTPRNYTVIGYKKVNVSTQEHSPGAQLIDAYQAQKMKDAAANSQFPQGPGILLNVNAVFINEVNNLVFNIHELVIAEAVIKLAKTEFLKNKIAAQWSQEKGEFVFSEGSAIAINRSGMLVLESSNEDIPVIYIPPVLGKSLGVATAGQFAGNQYYNPIADISKTISTTTFWHNNIEAFIKNIQLKCS